MAQTNNHVSTMPPSTYHHLDLDFVASTAARRRRWPSSLSSGLRAALACTIVGVVSVYSPPALRRHLTFPAFSYVVTVIIVTDATLGTALRAAASALHATVMGAAPSMLALWLAHRTGAAESVLATTAVVALSAFAVALPESPGPLAKRIALGQIIIIYVARFKRGEHPGQAFAVVHPANVAACTALGVAAALLAVLLPCPRLATRVAREKSMAYGEVAAERVRVLVDAFATCAEGEDDHEERSSSCGNRRWRRWCMAACMSEANRLASASAALLRRVTSIKGDLQWEHKWWAMQPLSPAPLADQLHGCIEMPIKGMEIALLSISNTSTSFSGSSLSCSSSLQQMRDQIRLALLTNHTTTSTEKTNRSPLRLTTTMSMLPQMHEELAPFLFLFSMHLLHSQCSMANHAQPDRPVTSTTQDKMMINITSKVTPAATSQDPTDNNSYNTSEEEEEEELQGGGGEDEEEEQPAAKTSLSAAAEAEKKNSNNLCSMGRERLIAAMKCAVSLGLAVLLGLLFSNDHGFWSGLIVATTMPAAGARREPTWALALARAHGTALGSVYGVLGCLISQRHHLMDLRFVALLPWIVLATSLKRSRAYGPAGGVAAALSGIIIVGRRYDEPAMAFTITRLVETFIGLACTVLSDLAFFQPAARPSARARAQLCRCVAALRECFCCADDGGSVQQQQQMVMVQEQVALLGKYAAEARSEPSYLWVAPFPAGCYERVQGSMSRMAQLLGLYRQARAIIPHHTDQPLLGADIQRFHGVLSTSLERLRIRLRLRRREEEETVEFEFQEDLEAGKGICRCCCEEEEPMVVVQSFLAHAREALQEQQQEAEAVEQQEQLLVCLGSIGFCMGELIKEAQQLEAHMLDLRLQPH